MQSSRELLESLANDASEQAASSPKDELRSRYRPLLQAFAHRIGVEAGRIDESIEAAFNDLYESARREDFDPRIGGRERLFHIAKKHIAEASLSASDALQSDDALNEAWNAEWRRVLIRYSIRTLSSSTDTDHRAVQAFEMHVIEKRGAAEVAGELGMSPTAVHGAKNLLLGKLQALMDELEERF